MRTSPPFVQSSQNLNTMSSTNNYNSNSFTAGNEEEGRQGNFQGLVGRSYYNSDVNFEKDDKFLK